MSILKIARMGHPALRARARAIDRGEIKSAAVQKLIDDMIETMTEYHGVGLAAPQVHEGMRIFVAAIGPEEEEQERPEAETLVIVNPEITPIGSDVFEDWEGCLSIPDIRGRVSRSREVRLRGLSRKGERLDQIWQGFSARVVQHETDHLDGILFVDRMRSLETLTFLDEYSRYWKQDE